MPRKSRQAQPDVPHVITCRVEDNIVELMKQENLRAYWEARLQPQYSPLSNRMIIAVPLFSFKAWSASERAHIIELATQHTGKSGWLFAEDKTDPTNVFLGTQLDFQAAGYTLYRSPDREIPLITLPGDQVNTTAA